MPNWAEILNEINRAHADPNIGDNALDVIRRKYLLALHAYTGRNIIAYYSAWLNRGNCFGTDINDKELDEALVKAKSSLIYQGAQIAIENFRQNHPAITVENIKEQLDLAARAANSVYKNAIEEQFAKERIGLYALNELTQCPEEKVTENNPNETWMNRFLKYAGDMRDEDVLQLWGKILAGEIKNPGSFSLKTLDILYCLDQKYAKAFIKFAPYVMNERYLPTEACKGVGFKEFQMADMESTGLFITSLQKLYEGMIIASNRSFVVAAFGDVDYPLQNYHLDAVFLTEAGSEIYRIIPLTVDQSRYGAEFFKNLIMKNFSIDLEIRELK